MANPLEAGRSLAGQEAIDYLETIWDTHTQAEVVHGDEGNYLTGLAALVALEEAHLYWLATQEIPKDPIVIAPTGFPSLPTLLADAKVALVRQEAIVSSRQRTALDILADFSKMDAEALRGKASERTRQLTSVADGFIKTIGRIDLHDMSLAKDMVVTSLEAKYKPRPGRHWFVIEEKSLVSVQLYDHKRKVGTVGFRFFPVASEKDAQNPSHPFFLVFSLMSPEVSPFSREKEPDWMKKLNLYLINWTGLHDSIKRILLTYDTFRYRKYTQTAFDALFKAHHALQILGVISQAKVGESKRDDVMAAQIHLADAISEIGTLPPELSQLIGAAIQDSAKDIKEKLS